MNREVYIIKSTGEKELFNPDKLANSLKLAGAKKTTVEQITEHIGKELEEIGRAHV